MVKDTLQFAGLSGNVRFTADGIGNRDPNTANFQLRSWQLHTELSGFGRSLVDREKMAWIRHAAPGVPSELPAPRLAAPRCARSTGVQWCAFVARVLRSET